MPPKTAKRVLKDVLEDLGERNFEKFCSELLDRRDGVKKSQVEGKGFLVVTDVMVSVYTEKKVLNVAEEILREIDCGQEAEDLVAEAKKAGLQISADASSDVKETEKAGLQSLADASSDEEHFVDKHRVELTQRVSGIPPILDKLLKAKIISDEDYAEILALKTSQARMRALYSSPVKATRKTKDIFLQILKEEQPYLIEDLMKP